jgi:hypothetical protein
MTDIFIQVHSHREPSLDLDRLCAQCERLANETDLICRFSSQEFEGGAYVNLTFQADNAKLVWSLLHERLYQSNPLGKLLRTSSIAVCEGRLGWDDYLLLHHFDVGEKCDVFPEG